MRPSLIHQAAFEALEDRTLLAAAYDWQSAQIGGGGFVSGVLFSPTQQGLAYARTDVGGAYRWDAGAGQWTPLNDFQPDSEFNSAGVESIAIDPRDAGKFYMTVGTYGTSSTWGPMGILYRSSDQGRSFSRVSLPFKVASNSSGRGNGERMVVDPHNSNILFYGARSWLRSDNVWQPSQLWKSTNGGTTWSAVSSFTYASGVGFSFLRFDPNSSSASGTQTIYAGLSQLGSVGANLYKSIDAGANWTPITGTGSLPGSGFMPMRESLTPDGSTMYVTYASTAGPGDAYTGGVWKLDTTSSVWTNVTPSQPGAVGYGGVCVDPQSPTTVVVSTLASYSPRNLVLRSSDGGLTWKDLRTNAVIDASSAPYAAGVSAHWCNDIKIDPFDRDHALVVSGNGIWSLNDMTVADGSAPRQPVNHWSFNAQNLEETVVTDIVSPAAGPHLLVVHADYGGFVIDDPTVNSAATAVRYNPAGGSQSVLDCAQNAPHVIVRGGGTTGYVSTDSGKTWTTFSGTPAGISGVGSMAVSADGRTIVWSPTFATGYPAAIYHSNDLGRTWNPSTVPVTGGEIIADRSHPDRFFIRAYSGSTMYASFDKGASFRSLSIGRTASGLWATPGVEGDLWMSSSGLYHSTNGGATWALVASVSVSTLGFGKPAPGKTYPAMYLYGTVSGISGKQIYRSDNEGVTWTRINDAQHQFQGSVKVISGDPRVYGRVYIGTGNAGGRGTLYADLHSGLPTGWSQADIGSPALPGNSAMGVDPTVRTWLSKAGGTGIGGTSDQFNFTSKTLAGDATTVVRVNRLDNSSNNAIAGIMFRASSATNAMYAMVGVTAGNGLVFSSRTSTGGTASATTLTAGPSHAAWLKLVRTGNSFTASYATTAGRPTSSDWIALGTQTVALPSTASAGLATCSANASIATTAVFSDLAFASPPTVVTAAYATASSVTGTTTALSVVGDDADGESSLTYTWAQTSGPGTSRFSANGSNAAKSTSVTFPVAGTYTFQVTMADAAGASVTSSVSVTVVRTVTTLSISPSRSTLPLGGTQQFAALFLDQFGVSMGTASPTWTLISGDGTLDSTGFYTAPARLSSATIQAVAGAMTATMTVYVRPSALKADFSFNEAAGTTVVDSANGNVGTLVNGPVFVTGRMGSALSFDGTNDRVDLGSPTALNITGQITLAAWVKTSSTSGLRYIIARGAASNPETFLRINGGYYEAGSYDGSSFFARAAIPAGDLDTWVFLAGVYDGTAWRLYRNGVQLASTTSTKGALASTATWTIGASAAPSRFYSGIIDSVRIYDVGLGAAEVLAISNQGITLTTAATATPAAVTGTSTAVSVEGTDPDTGGDESLMYTWSATGPAEVTFSANGTNAAKNTTAIFTLAGSYTLTATITDIGGLEATSSVVVTVTQTATRLVIAPESPSIPGGNSQQFQAFLKDQFDSDMATQPTLAWSLDSGGGTISPGGLYTAPSVAGIATVKAVTGSFSATMALTVAQTPIILDNAAAAGVTITGSWTTSTSIAGYYGTNYLHNGNTGRGSKSVRFTPTLPLTGAYEVYARWSATTGRATNTPIDINHAGGTVTTRVDQTKNNGTWVLMGTYGFRQGTSGSVVFRTDNTNGYVTVDGVMFVKVQASPTVVAAAEAVPGEVTETTTDLSVVGADIAGEPGLAYTWSATGPAAVTFSENGSNAAQNTTATFAQAGIYDLMVTITNLDGLSTTSSVAVAVAQTPAGIAITPGSATLASNGQQPFSARVLDQFGVAMTTQPGLAWNVTAGPGTIDAAGLYRAPFASGSATVTATSGAIMGSAAVTIANAAPTITTAAAATPTAVTGTAATLHVLGADDAGETNLTYTWSKTSGPGGITFSANGTNAAKRTTATFAQPGSYGLLVTITDAGGLSTTSSVNVTVNEPLTSIAENTSTATRIKLTDIVVTDGALGSEPITLTGADAASFEVVGRALYLASGVRLDFETRASYSVTVNVTDTSLPGSPTTSTAFTLTVTDVNEPPTGVALADTTTSIAETTSTATRIRVADIVVTDDALGSKTITLTGPDAASFEVDGLVLFLRSGVVLDRTTQASYGVTVTVADPSLSGSIPVTAAFSLAVTAADGVVVISSGAEVVDAIVRTGTTSLVKQGPGTLILDKANTHSGGTTIEAGELIIRNRDALGSGGLTVKSGATVTLDVGTNSVAVGALTLEPGGRIDLGYGQVAIAAGGSSLAAVRQRLQRSYESGWTAGDGFMSRLAATVEGGRLGYLVHDDTSLTVGFAAAGDTNLDGVVDIIDCANLVSLGKYNSDESAGWAEGDFNYDGVVDVLDAVEFMATGLFNADAYVPAQSARSAAVPELSAMAAAFVSFSIDSTTTLTTPRKRAFARL